MLQRTPMMPHLPQVQLLQSQWQPAAPTDHLMYCIWVRVRVRPMHNNHRSLSTMQRSVRNCLNLSIHIRIYSTSGATATHNRVRADDQTRDSRTHAIKCMTHQTPHMYVTCIGSWRETYVRTYVCV